MEQAELELSAHAEFTIGSAEIVSREVSSAYDRDTANSDLIRMTVKAFGWEVNRNGFMHKKKVLKRAIEDAFREKLPMYRTFEGKLVDRNHLMKDSGSRHDEPIGFIESSYIKEDGVYFDMWIWKRCISDEEQRQIRANEVSISMEVDFTKPVVILDGEEFIATKENRAMKGAVRSYADDATVNGLGIAVLFDGITPGYASASVVATENAVLDLTQEPTEDTVPVNKERGIEAASVETQTPEENQMENETLQAELAAKDAALAELSSANEALSAKNAELNKLYDELQALREKAFNDSVSASFDLGKLEPLTAGWLLDMLRWSGDLESTCAKLVEVAGAIKAPATKPTETADAGVTVPEVTTETSTEAPAVEQTTEGGEATTEPAAVENAASTEEEPSAAPETETATTPAVNIASGTQSQFGTETPKWGIEHL